MKKRTFNNYVRDKAISLDGKTGTVKLSFTVSSNGALSGFKVTKSLSDVADKPPLTWFKKARPGLVMRTGNLKLLRLRSGFINSIK